MRGRSKFGRICGMKTKLWKMLSLTYSSWQLIRINGCAMLGRRKERWEVGIPYFQDTLTIGKWKRWRACSEKSILWLCIVMWRMFWVERLARMTLFFVRSLYRSLTHVSSELFPWSIIWRSWAPMRVSFFAWEVSWTRILTIDQLKRRGWNMPNKCYLCKMEEETSDHLIIFCKNDTMLWNLIFSLFEV